jgi:hypothetical protein
MHSRLGLLEGDDASAFRLRNEPEARAQFRGERAAHVVIVEALRHYPRRVAHRGADLVERCT